MEQEVAKNDELSLKDLILKIKEIWKYLLSKWVIILICGLLGGGIGLTASLLGKTKYIATLSFVVQEKESSSGGLASLAGQFGFNVGGAAGGGAFSGDNLITLLKTRRLVEKTLLSPVNFNGKEQSLAESYIEINNIREGWELSENPALKNLSFPAGGNRDAFSRVQDSVLLGFYYAINESLLVERPAKGASIVTAKYTNGNEMFSKLFVEQLVNVVTDFYVETRIGQTKKNIAIMEAKADSLKKEFDKALYLNASSADQNRDIARQTLMVSVRKNEANTQFLGTAYMEVLKNLEVLKMDLARDTPLIQVIDYPILPLQKERLGKAKGIVLGGIVGGFLSVCGILAVMFYRSVMKEEDGEANAA